MVAEPTTTLPDRLRARLRFAMKDRDEPAVAALRTALAAIDNARSVGIGSLPPNDETTPVAGARSGVGSTDVPRQHLDDADVEAIVRDEIAERETAAIALRRAGEGERADRLQAEARVLATVIGGR